MATTVLTMESVTMETSTTNELSASDLCHSVTSKVNDASFLDEHKDSRAPLAMLAFAGVVVESIIRKRNVNTSDYFNGLAMTVPSTKEAMPAQYHSIVGQELLYVNWKEMFGLEVNCTRCPTGILGNDRTNFSKNKILFPIFDLEGAPRWCMTMSMVCNCCRMRTYSNTDKVLCQLPAYARNAYPVEVKYALADKNCHLGRTATHVFDLIMPTYGNGDLCSRLLYNAVNRSYLQRLENYFSCYKAKSIDSYLEKDGEYIRTYPPLGDGIRDTYDQACSNNNTPWSMSDHDRHTREIQAVGADLIFAQDHTHEVTKNYFQKKRLGAFALWDVATETGEIAAAVLVPTTKTKHFSHAAKQLSLRPNFKPSAMYSDTWPIKSSFWDGMFDGRTIQGRLGLFHCIQRITRTLKKTHSDYFSAVNGLLHSIYRYNEQDYEKLLLALKNGSLSKYSDEEISDLKTTKLWRQRYGKYLQKEIRPPATMRAMLDDWFDRYKCSTTNPDRPARGRLDPLTGETLFTADTKDTLKNCKDKAQCLQDPLPLDHMYAVITPSPNSAHGLNECLSRRGESSLESFPLTLAHFGNCGMRTTLADNLNLTGTARYNTVCRSDTN